jgi:hypothetical protein
VAQGIGPNSNPSTAKKKKKGSKGSMELRRGGKGKENDSQ